MSLRPMRIQIYCESHRYDLHTCVEWLNTCCVRVRPSWSYEYIIDSVSTSFQLDKHALCTTKPHTRMQNNLFVFFSACADFVFIFIVVHKKFIKTKYWNWPTKKLPSEFDSNVFTVNHKTRINAYGFVNTTNKSFIPLFWLIPVQSPVYLHLLC